ncbi:hypothetical protein KKA39_00475 [Patescibacteria group bacterium]|nr:hypothetical protein [Patescibacteria group bacterium]
MINKHFFKTLLIFTGMIILGLVGALIASYFDDSGEQSKILNKAIPLIVDKKQAN